MIHGAPQDGTPRHALRRYPAVHRSARRLCRGPLTMKKLVGFALLFTVIFFAAVIGLMWAPIYVLWFRLRYKRWPDDGEMLDGHKSARPDGA
jgi:hypothetical protein